MLEQILKSIKRISTGLVTAATLATILYSGIGCKDSTKIIKIYVQPPPPPPTRVYWVAFTHQRNGADLEIYTIGSDGIGGARLTYNSIDDDEPDWSPDT